MSSDLSKAQIAHILKLLLEIKEKGPNDSNRGICLTISDYATKEPDRRTRLAECFEGTQEFSRAKDRWLKNKFSHWPHFSGNENYPVPHTDVDDPDEIDAEFRFDNATPEEMWDRTPGTYGALRWQLVDFLISEAEKEVAALA